MAALRQDMECGFENLRMYTLGEVAATRKELTEQVQQVTGWLIAAQQDIVNLRAGLLEATAYNDMTYVTKAMHNDACRDIVSKLDSCHEDLKTSLDMLRAASASKAELEDITGQMRGAHEALDQQHMQTANTLDDAGKKLARLDRKSREELTSKDSFEEALTIVRKLRQEADDAHIDRLSLNSEMTSEKERLEETNGRQGEQAKQLANSLQNHSNLSREVTALRDELFGRCDILDRDLKALDRREKSSWEQFTRDRR